MSLLWRIWASGLLVLVGMCLPHGGWTQVLHDVEATGVVKSTDIYMQASPGVSSGGVSLNQARADLSFEVGALFSFEFAAENRLTASEMDLASLAGYEETAQGLDLDTRLHDGRRSRDSLFIDRLNLTLENRNSKLTLGRQAIGFGRISGISPLDVICPFSPEAVDTEIRTGVDAIQGVHYFGVGGQVGATAVFGEEEDNNSYLATFSTHLGGTDILAMAGALQNRAMAGAGLAFDIGGLGLKGELALYRGKDVQSASGDLYSSFAVGALEAWYRFENGLNVLAEYYYNGAGVGDSQDYARVAASAFTLEGLNYLAGRHYLIAGPSYELHPLVTLEGLLLWNLFDRSLLIRSLVDISVSEDVVAQVYWTFKTGSSQSEFGESPDYGGVCLKFYF